MLNIYAWMVFDFQPLSTLMREDIKDFAKANKIELVPFFWMGKMDTCAVTFNQGQQLLNYLQSRWKDLNFQCQGWDVPVAKSSNHIED